MEIHHRVKPLHGWREFFGEVGIIVLGVLLALGAEQIAEAIHWHREVAEGRETLSGELAGNFDAVWQREILSHCLAKRLDDIAAILDQAQRTHRLPPVGELGAPGRGMFGLPSWAALSASGVAAHFPRSEVLAYASIDSGGQRVTDLNVLEGDDWTRLYTIVGPGRPISDSELGDLRTTLSEAGTRGANMRLSAFQLKGAIKDLNLPLDREFAAHWPARLAVIRKRAATAHLCQPLGPAPAHYGQIVGRKLLEMPLDEFR